MHRSSGPPRNGPKKLSSSDCSGPLLEGCSQGCVNGDPKPGAGGYSKTCVTGSRIDASGWSMWAPTLYLLMEVVERCWDKNMPPPQVSTISTQ